MITAVDERLRQEARRFVLRFTCESCLGFDPEKKRCANGFPNQAHHEVDLDTAQHIVFCKEFELA